MMATHADYPQHKADMNPNDPLPPLLRLLDAIDYGILNLVFHYSSEAKSCLAIAKDLMDNELKEWRDDEARCLLAWLEFAYPDPLVLGEARAHHMGFALGRCQEIVRHRWLTSIGVLPPSAVAPVLKWPKGATS
jgi:hypothetical protein